MKNWYTITALANAPAEVYVFGPIGNSWDGEGITARQFIEDFQAIDSNEVSLLVNSPGGSLFDGIAIYTALASSGKKITAKVMGVAASAASLLIMAAQKITMPQNTHLMVHKAGWVASGNADDLRTQAAVLDGLDNSIIATYAARTGQTEDDIRTLLGAGDVWMSADEAVAAGFADEVIPLVAVTNQYDPATLPAAVRATLTPPPVAATGASLMLDQVEAICAAAGLQAHAAVFALDETLTTIAEVQAAVDEAGQITALCRVTGAAAQTAAFITARKSLHEVRATLIAARAAEDERNQIDNTQRTDPPEKPAKTAGTGPVAIWAARKGAAA